MRIEDLTKAWYQFRSKPLLTLLLFILLSVIVAFGIWITAYLGEKGKIAATSTNLPGTVNREIPKKTQVNGRKTADSALSNSHASVVPEMVEIPASNFLFGNPKATTNTRKYLSTYWISRYEITNQQYKSYIEDNPNVTEPSVWDDKNFNLPQQPVVYVSWFEAANYCLWLSKKTGYSFSLPTEEQWEKAARALTNSVYPWGDSSPTQKKANFNNQHGYPNIVSGYSIGRSRSFGIYNMAGNVAEWCTNSKSDAIFVKGGSFRDSAHFLKIHVHNEQKPDGLPWVGFRVVRSK
jgi:formylglycine-generating enzyme required for sulfatase activity